LPALATQETLWHKKDRFNWFLAVLTSVVLQRLVDVVSQLADAKVSPLLVDVLV
jgi:hypothetical protein